MMEKNMLPEDFYRYVESFLLSERFGWTPEEINDMDAKDYVFYLSLASGISESERKELERLKNTRVRYG